MIITLFIFIGANFNNPNALPLYIYDAAIFALFLCLFCLILVYHRHGSFKKSFNLLDEIFRDGLTDVELIRKRWYYPEEKNMLRKFVKDYLPNKMAKVGFIIGIVTLTVFIIILPILYTQGLITLQELINGLLFSVCIGIISFGVHLIFVAKRLLLKVPPSQQVPKSISVTFRIIVSKRYPKCSRSC